MPSKVDFADQSAHRPVAMTRDQFITLGALGSEALIVATRGDNIVLLKRDRSD